MGKIYKSVDELVGRTPLVELTKIESKLGLKAKLLAKFEYFNPAGSVKDRIALAMIEDAEAKGLLTIIGKDIDDKYVAGLSYTRMTSLNVLGIVNGKGGGPYVSVAGLFDTIYDKAKCVNSCSLRISFYKK